MIPPKSVGLSGNVLFIYLILYMRSGRMAFCCSLLLAASFRRLWFATDYVVMFGMALVLLSVVMLDY